MDTNIDWVIKLNLNSNNYKTIINKKIKSLKAIDVTNKSTRGIKSRQYDLFETFKNDADLQFILGEIKKHIAESLKSRIEYAFDLNILSAWTVIGKKASYHIVHKHNEKMSHIATVLYLDTPKLSVNEEGAFYFFLNDNNTVRYYHFTPKTNDLIIMPVWIYHGVYPQGNGNRQTLNIDFEITPNVPHFK